MQVIVLGQTVLAPVNLLGDVEQYQLSLPAAGHYVFQQAGPGTCEIDVYGPFPDGVPLVPGTGNGKLKVCGLSSWGMRVLQQGTYLVVTTQTGAGQFSILARASVFPQWLLDAMLTRYLHKSSC